MTNREIERWWAAVGRHAETITLEAMIDMTKALGLRLAVKVSDAQGIETRSAIDPKGRGPKDESPVP